MKLFKLILIISIVSGCVGIETLPPQGDADEIRIEINQPKETLLIIKDEETVNRIVAFINTKLEGWSSSLTGPPVGQVYFLLYKEEKFVGNFYIGKYFFGRDYDSFWSQPATTKEIEKLGNIVGIDLLTLINK